MYKTTFNFLLQWQKSMISPLSVMINGLPGSECFQGGRDDLENMLFECTVMTELWLNIKNNLFFAHSDEF